MVKVFQSAGNQTEIGMDVEHGPDGGVYTTLKSGIISNVAISATPTLLVGSIGAASSNSEVVGEWILPVLRIKKTDAGSGQKWALVEVYEMRKPF